MLNFLRIGLTASPFILIIFLFLFWQRLKVLTRLGYWKEEDYQRARMLDKEFSKNYQLLNILYHTFFILATIASAIVLHKIYFILVDAYRFPGDSLLAGLFLVIFTANTFIANLLYPSLHKINWRFRVFWANPSTYGLNPTNLVVAAGRRFRIFFYSLSIIFFVLGLAIIFIF